MPGATGLAAKDGDAYVADPANGSILQIIDDGVVLDAPVMAFSGLDSPGASTSGKAGCTSSRADPRRSRASILQSGKRTTIGTDLGFQDPSFPDRFPFGFLNNVTVSDTTTSTSVPTVAT